MNEPTGLIPDRGKIPKRPEKIAARIPMFLCNVIPIPRSPSIICLDAELVVDFPFPPWPGIVYLFLCQRKYPNATPTLDLVRVDFLHGLGGRLQFGPYLWIEGRHSLALMFHVIWQLN